MRSRIVVTGGSGKAGQYIISHLRQNNDILNLDLKPLTTAFADVHTIICDLTDSGQVFNALSSHFQLTQPLCSPAMQVPDAVIYLAGYARNMLVPDNETFRGNTIGTYNVLEAACKLGVKKIIIASSVCVYGVTYAIGDVDFPSFPVDESLDVNPMDTYAISKVCCERTARGFARRFGVDTYILRIGAVIAPDEYSEVFPSYVDQPEKWKVHGWSYTDARDLAQICELCIAKDGLGYQLFNATNDTITNNLSTMDLLRQQCPQTPFTRELGPREAPMTNRKIKDVLGFRENHDWRTYYPPR